MLMELNEIPPKREMSKMLAFFALLAVFLPVSLRWWLEIWTGREMLCFDTIMLMYNKSNRGNARSLFTMG
jgi:hypothetical protein